MFEALNSLVAVLLTMLNRDLTFLSGTEWLWLAFAVPGIIVAIVLFIKWFMITAILTMPLWVPIAMVHVWRRL